MSNPKNTIFIKTTQLDEKIQRYKPNSIVNYLDPFFYYSKAIEFTQQALRHPALNSPDLELLRIYLENLEQIIEAPAGDELTKKRLADNLSESAKNIERAFAEERFNRRTFDKRSFFYAVGQTLSVVTHLGMLAAGIIIPIVCFPPSALIIALFILIVGLKGQILPAVVLDLGLDVWGFNRVNCTEVPVFTISKEVNELAQPAAALSRSNYSFLFSAKAPQLAQEESKADYSPKDVTPAY